MTDTALAEPGGREQDLSQAVHGVAKTIGDLLLQVPRETEAAFGFRPNEMGIKVLEAMFAGKPLAPLLNIDRSQIDSTFAVAREQVKAGHLHDAVKLLRLLVMIDYHNKRHWLALALCLRKLGLLTSAGDSYCVAHVVERDDLWPLVRAIECYLEARDLANARDLLEILGSLRAPDRLPEDAPEGAGGEELTAAVAALAARVDQLQAEHAAAAADDGED